MEIYHLISSVHLAAISAEPASDEERRHSGNYIHFLQCFFLKTGEDCCFISFSCRDLIGKIIIFLWFYLQFFKVLEAEESLLSEMQRKLFNIDFL